MADWQPLVTDPVRRDQIVALIREIVAATPAAADMAHQLDQALLRAYLAQDATIEDPDDVVGSSLAAAVNAFVTTPVMPWLYSGACGVGWSIEHLAGGETAQHVCAAVDRALLQRLENWTGDYDLISGLVGFGVYALERGEAGHAILARILDHLETTARPQPNGIAWHTSPELLPEWQRVTSPDGYWNLGLAHGNPGVIGLLARCVRHGAHAGRARALLDGAMPYLLAVAPASDRGRYPAWLPSQDPVKRRLAWCYGDLGVSLGMLSAALACERADWRAEAIALARGCAGADDPSVRDAGLCHGTAGALHLFARLWNATGESVFADAARAWLDRTFEIRRADDYAGFPTMMPEADGERWEPSASLLTGTVGVALALHAAISQVEPTWDRTLLVDI